MVAAVVEAGDCVGNVGKKEKEVMLTGSNRGRLGQG